MRTVESYRAEVMDKMRAESVAGWYGRRSGSGASPRRITTRSIRILVSIEAPIIDISAKQKETRKHRE
jgi:hypothetical protein